MASKDNRSFKFVAKANYTIRQQARVVPIESPGSQLSIGADLAFQ